MKLTLEQWMKEARRAGEHFWCYKEFVDDNPDRAATAYYRGEDPYDYIEQEGERLDLHKFGKAWA